MLRLLPLMRPGPTGLMREVYRFCARGMAWPREAILVAHRHVILLARFEVGRRLYLEGKLRSYRTTFEPSRKGGSSFNKRCCVRER